MRGFSILTGNSGGVRVLVGVLHVLHQRLAAEEELVAYWTAGCVRAADQGGVLLEHNTLLQLLFWGAREKKYRKQAHAAHRVESRPREYHHRVANQKRRTGRAQNRTIFTGES